MTARGRIAYLTGQYPNAGTTFIQVEVQELRRLGFEVVTFSVREPPRDQLVSPSLTAEHARTTYLFDGSKLRLLAAALWALRTRTRRVLLALAQMWETVPPGVVGRVKGLAYVFEACLLAREMERAGIKHLHNHLAEASATVAMIAAQLAGIRYSLTEHGSGIFFHPRAWNLGAKIERSAFTVCISDFCRSQCMLFAPRQAWQRIHVVRACVQPAFLGHPPVPIPEAPRLLFIGRLTPEKGVPVLLEAVRRLAARGTAVELSLIGDGPLREEARAGLASLGAGLRLLGWRSSEEVRAELARARVLVVPSFTEGLPVVIMEALASYRPVIATQIAGIGELVEDGVNGWLIPAGAVDALEAALASALAMAPERLLALGTNGAARVAQEHDPRIEVPKLASLIDESLRESEASLSCVA